MASRARLAGILAGALLSLVAAMAVRTATVESKQQAPDGPPEPVDTSLAASLVSEAVAFPTISGREHAQAFSDFHTWHRARFPVFYETVGVGADTLNQSLLFVWKGSDPDLEPVLFLAHQDVVPVEAGTEGDWTYPPFSGAIAPCGEGQGDCVWGRGTIDMKVTLVALTHAVEVLANAGWTPTRTLYFWFSDDEEIGGAASQDLDQRLEDAEVQFGFILDEGLVVTDGMVPGVQAPAALIGIAEKGYLSVEITASGGMGHSSMPPPTTTVGDLSRVIAALEADPMPASLDGPAEAMFAHLAPEMKMPERAVFSNLWLTRSLVLGQLEAGRATNALVRTTQAATQLFASEADNVLPQKSRAVVNYRLHPRDSMASVQARVQGIADSTGGDVTVKPFRAGGNVDPSKVSPVDHPGYRFIHAAMRRELPESVVAPGLFIAATDSRHLQERSDATYRFAPIRMQPHDVGRAHGTDERVRVADLGWAFAFYRDIVRSAGDWTTVN